MILAIDIGNTNIVIGCVEQGEIQFVERISTDHSKTELEYAVLVKTIFDIHHIEAHQIEGGIISSVVPPLTNIVKSAVEKLSDANFLIVGPGVKTGLNILMDDPRSVGADLIVDAVAGIQNYGTPLILIDMGTATTISVIDPNGSYIGGMIIPGIRKSLDGLVEGTAQLPAISLEAPKRVVAKDTIDAMKSGIVLGTASMMDGQIERIEDELGYSCKVVATGGLAKSIIPLCKRKVIIDDGLLLKGLDIIYHKNI